MRTAATRLVLCSSLVLAACGGGGPRPTAAPAAAAPLDLAAYVPGDTPYALFVPQVWFQLPEQWLAKPRQDWAAGLAKAGLAEAPTPADRFWREVARALHPLDDRALRAAGWLPGQSEAVLYGAGLAPVVRVRVDGARAQALIDGAARRAGVTLTAGTWRGTAYQILPHDDDDAALVVATSKDQLAIGVANDPELVIAHVATFAPSPAPLSARWPVDGAARQLHVDPVRLAAALQDTEALARLGGPPDEPGCVAAVAGFVAELPPTTATVALTTGTLEMTFDVEVTADTANVLRAAPIPGWLDDDVPAIRMGFGAPPYPVLAHLATLVDRGTAAAAACGEGSAEPFPLAQLAPLATVTGASGELAALGGDELTATVAVGVRDVPALWAMLSHFMPPLGTSVPAVGELRMVPLPGGAVQVTVSRNGVIASMGSHAARRIEQLLAARPGPARIALMRTAGLAQGVMSGKYRFLGQPLGGDADAPPSALADSFTEVGLEGNRLTIRFAVELPAEIPAGQ